ncbi:MAG: DUF2339 domain-containing protein [Candidatus Dependentiae bacterium]|nr:DUF2339 domain-containing protein [Candidatus Dependentiae bacterium]
MDSKWEELLQLIKELKQRLIDQESRIEKIERKLIVSKEVEPKKDYQTVSETASNLNKYPNTKEIKPESTSMNWEKFEFNMGKYGLQIIGMIVFLIGMAFLLKYSIEKGFLSPLVRVTIALMVSTGLVTFSEYIRKRFSQWGMGCSAAGIVLYYFSFYVAYKLYGLINQPIALISLVGVTILAALLSIRHSSKTIALFSLVGGFYAPLLVSFAHTNSIFLACYIIVLSLGFLMLTYITQWYFITAFSFFAVGMYDCFVLQDSLSLHQHNLFFVALGITFIGIPLLYSLVRNTQRRFFEPILTSFAGFYLFIRIAANINSSAIEYLCAFFGMGYLIALLVVFVRNKHNAYLLGSLFSCAVSFFAGVLFMHWTGNLHSVAFGMYALFLFLTGTYACIPLIRYFSYFFWVYSSWHLILTHAKCTLASSSLLLNSINASTGIIFLLFIVGVLIVRSQRRELCEDEDWASSALEGCAIMTIPYWMHTCVWIYPYHILGLMWYSFFLLVLGFRLHRPLWRIFGYGCGIISALYVLIVLCDNLIDIFSYSLVHPDYFWLLNIVSISWVFITLWVLRSVYLYKRYLAPYEKHIAAILSVIAIVSIYLWVRVNVIIGADSAIEGVHYLRRTELTNVLLTIVAGLYAVMLIALGLIKHKSIVRYMGFVFVCISLLRLTLILMNMSDSVFRIIGFICIGLLMAGTSFLYQKFSTYIVENKK